MKKIGKGMCLFQLIPEKKFKNLCDEFNIDKKVRRFTAQTQVIVLIHCFLLKLESLREIEITLGVPRSTLSDANSARNCLFFEKLCKIVLWEIHGKIKSRKIKKALRNILAVDSTEIRVNGRLAKENKWKIKRSSKIEGKASSKLHVIWDLERLCIDDFSITGGRDHDAPVAGNFKIKADFTYVFDRAYNDISLWFKIMSTGSHFVTRLKDCTLYRTRRFSMLNDYPDKVGVLSEREWKPSSSLFSKHKEIPKDFKCRHIMYKCPETKKIFDFITSDFTSSAEEIAEIYKKRWAVELLFRWLKGHLNIRSIDARNTNAAEIILSIAVLVQLLIRLYHVILKMKGTLWECLRTIRMEMAREGVPPFYSRVPP
jgi:putative transposase